MLNALNLNEDADDGRLRAALSDATAIIRQQLGRWLEPTYATRYHTANGAHDLPLEVDLLELDAIRLDDGTTVDLDTVALVPADGPASVLQWLYPPQMVGFADETLAIDGLWGWHPAPAAMWRDSGATIQTANLTANATTFEVADSTAADTHGDAPALSVGHLLRIEDEFLRVTDIEITVGTDTVHVLRGVNGTDAVAHPIDTAVYTYQPPRDLARLVLRWAIWLYREPDAANLPLPPDFLPTVRRLRRW